MDLGIKKLTKRDEAIYGFSLRKLKNKFGPKIDGKNQIISSYYKQK